MFLADFCAHYSQCNGSFGKKPIQFIAMTGKSLSTWFVRVTSRKRSWKCPASRQPASRPTITDAHNARSSQCLSWYQRCCCILLCFWATYCKSTPSLRTTINQCLSMDSHNVRYSSNSYLMAANWSLIFPRPSIIVSNASRLSSNCTCRVSGRALVEEGASSTWSDIRILGIWMSESYGRDVG